MPSGDPGQYQSGPAAHRHELPARGTTLAGLEITEPTLFDETNGGPVPLVLPCEVSVSPGPGGAS